MNQDTLKKYIEIIEKIQKSLLEASKEGGEDLEILRWRGLMDLFSLTLEQIDEVRNELGVIKDKLSQ